jgi:hypothetical protein
MKRTKGKPPIPMFKGPKKTYYLEKLNWILDFANLDIEDLPPGGFFKILYEYLVFFHSHDYPTIGILKNLCQDTERNRKALREAQTRIKMLLTSCHKHGESETVWAGFKTLFGTIEAKYFVIFQANTISLRPWTRLHPLKEAIARDEIHYGPLRIVSRSKEHLEIDEAWMAGAGFDPEKGLRFSWFFIEDIESSILIVLVPLLEKFPLSYIGICPDCEKFFRIKRKKQSPLCPVCLKRRRSREQYYSKKKGGK